MNLGFGYGFILMSLPPLKSRQRDDPSVTRLGQPGERLFCPDYWSEDVTAEMVTKDVAFRGRLDGQRETVTVHVTRFEAGGPPHVFHGWTVGEIPTRKVRGRFDPDRKTIELWLPPRLKLVPRRRASRPRRR